MGLLPNVFKMYSSTWKQIIVSADKQYNEAELGPEAGVVGGQRYIKETHHLRNIKGQSLFVALYVPVDSDPAGPETRSADGRAAPKEATGPTPSALHDRELDAEFGVSTFETLDCVVFLHAHNNNCLQGLFLKEWVLLRKKALCLFDFHGAGKSEGKYSTFGYFETLDLDAVAAG